jgi:hypothetical protein
MDITHLNALTCGPHDLQRRCALLFVGLNKLALVGGSDQGGAT